MKEAPFRSSPTSDAYPLVVAGEEEVLEDDFWYTHNLPWNREGGRNQWKTGR